MGNGAYGQWGHGAMGYRGIGHMAMRPHRGKRVQGYGAHRQ